MNMPYLETADGTRLHYTDWGTGTPVVFVSSWALSGAMWEYQQCALTDAGLRCVTYDRRGHGHSDDPGRGYDFDTFADDLAALLERLDLRNVTLVGHSMGCMEIIRYLARHGTDRIARAVLISPTAPMILQTPENPGGVPQAALDYQLAALQNDRPRYFGDGAINFFGLGAAWPATPVLSNEIVEWAIRLILSTPLRVVTTCMRIHWETDFRTDLAACSIPTTIIHGDRDLNAPLEMCGHKIAEAIPHSELRVYQGAPHGLFLTDKERLNRELLGLIQG